MTAPPTPPTVDALQQGGATGRYDATYGGTPSARTWLDHRHPDYAGNLARWTYAEDHYTGDVIHPDKIKHYLVRKAQGESKAAWLERLRLADYTNHIATVVDSLTGMFFAVEDDATRTAAETGGLGTLGDPATPLGRLASDADGAGAGILTQWKRLAAELLLQNVAWVMVDGNDDTPRVRILPARQVVNWVTAPDGRIVEALIQEVADGRAGLQDAPAVRVQYLHLTTKGWARYRAGDNNTVVSLTGEGDTGTYAYVDRAGRPMLPLVRVVLPLRRHVGYNLAKKCNAIFNAESERDAAARAACFPKLNIVGTRDDFDKIVADLAKGANALHQPIGTSGHNYIAPDQAPALARTEILKRKVEEFYITAFRQYGDAARERTATEVRQDVSEGQGAILQLLKGAIDNAENSALGLLEQFLFPTSTGQWWKASVRRSDNFLPPDAAKVIDAQNARIFGAGKGAPVGFSAQLAAATETAEYQGTKADPLELAAAVRVRALVDTANAMPNLPIPADARVALTLDALRAAGYFTKGGSLAGRERAVLEAATALALADDESRRREAEAFYSSPSSGAPSSGAPSSGAPVAGGESPNDDSSSASDA